MKALLITVAALALTSSAVAGNNHPVLHPVVKHHGISTAVKVVLHPAQPDLHPTIKQAQQTRAGYCINGIFTDLVLAQVPLSTTITYARFYKGIGITCDNLPGFTFQNQYVDGFGGVGGYAYFA